MVIKVNGMECTTEEACKLIAREIETENKAAEEDRAVYAAASLYAMKALGSICMHIQQMKEKKRDNWVVRLTAPRYLQEYFYEQVYNYSSESGIFQHYRSIPDRIIESEYGVVAVRMQEQDSERHTWCGVGVKNGRVAFVTIPEFLYEDVEKIGQRTEQ